MWKRVYKTLGASIILSPMFSSSVFNLVLLYLCTLLVDWVSVIKYIVAKNYYYMNVLKCRNLRDKIIANKLVFGHLT